MEKTKTSAVYGNDQNKPLPKVIKAGKFAALQASAHWLRHKKTQASSKFLKLVKPLSPRRAFFPLIANATEMFPRASIKPRCLLAQFLSALGKTSAADFSPRLPFERDSTVAAQFNGKEPSLFLNSSLFLLRFDIIGFKLGKEFFRLFDSDHAFGKKGQNVFTFNIIVLRCGNDGKQAKRHFFLCNGSAHSKGSHRIDRRHGLSFFIKTILPTIVKLPAVLIKKVGNRLVLKEKYFTPKGSGFQLYMLFFLPLQQSPLGKKWGA